MNKIKHKNVKKKKENIKDTLKNQGFYNRIEKAKNYLLSMEVVKSR